MSGYTELAAFENANIGSDSILLNKPFSTETLAHKIAEALQRTNAGQKALAAGECRIRRCRSGIAPDCPLSISLESWT